MPVATRATSGKPGRWDRAMPPAVPAEDLERRVRELAADVSRDYAGKDLVLVGVLKGAVFFLSDLMRQLDLQCEVDFMAVASYGSATKSSGVVRILKDLDAVIEGRDVLIVEDIVDSGLTLAISVAKSRRKESALVRGLRAPDQARAPQGRSPHAIRWLRDSRIRLRSVTGWTTTSDTATCPTWRR